MEILDFLPSKKEEAVEIVRRELFMKNGLKISLIVFKTKNRGVLPSATLEFEYDEMSEKNIKESEDFEKKDSGWPLYKILEEELRTNSYLPLPGSTFVELPLFLGIKRAIVNIKNNDQQCFKWAILSAVFPVLH